MQTRLIAPGRRTPLGTIGGAFLHTPPSHTMRLPARLFPLRPAAALVCVAAMSGCAVVSVAGAAAGAAISVTGAVVSTGVKVTGKVVEKTIDAVTPESDAD